MNMDKPIWVLTYLYHSEAWKADGTGTEMKDFPEVHTFCYDNEQAARDNWKWLDQQTKLRGQIQCPYHVHKTYLNKKFTEPKY
jgi:hypothetical protein